ncbi:hypothetical protein K2Z84_16790 [Candidatus Binatia bacterium]|nr:hypothetical protein [Candidatus Binatia bacterium]
MVENRWWVDANTSTKRRGPTPPAERETPPIVGRLFTVGRDFDQDRAKVRLTDANLHILKETNPAEDVWAYLPMTEQRTSKDFVERVKRSLRLPRGSRGVIVDSGSSLRAIATGNPFGERVIELTLGGDSSLDVWSHGEWIAERVFRSKDRALREAPHLLSRYLRSTE